ncbi:MAG: DUF1349 domain-containing protein [Alphaproteobacteria bacterium]|nr:DUF1349 domain-containing protein [Alphaproteobacteria bacterium]
MLLETLKEFDWHNDPQRVRFDDEGMHVTAKYRTDFWSCARHDFKKDDGHFFFSYAGGDFGCDVVWYAPEMKDFDQCGLMLRVDSDNWFKMSLMYDSDNRAMLASSLTNDGFSDLATAMLDGEVEKVWYKLKRKKGCYIASYSTDGVCFEQLRKFYLPHDTEEVSIGAYICSPQRDDFEAILQGLTKS